MLSEIAEYDHGMHYAKKGFMKQVRGRSIRSRIDDLYYDGLEIRDRILIRRKAAKDLARAVFLRMWRWNRQGVLRLGYGEEVSHLDIIPGMVVIIHAVAATTLNIIAITLDMPPRSQRPETSDFETEFNKFRDMYAWYHCWCCGYCIITTEEI